MVSIEGFMTHMIKLAPGFDDRPEWFKERYRTVMAEARSDDRALIPKPWTWYWNDKYEGKIRIRNCNLYVEFESEGALAWFILKES